MAIAEHGLNVTCAEFGVVTAARVSRRCCPVATLPGMSIVAATTPLPFTPLRGCVARKRSISATTSSRSSSQGGCPRVRDAKEANVQVPLGDRLQRFLELGADEDVALRSEEWASLLPR